MVILLGAGASAEADIPPSALMISELEKLLREDPEWSPFNGLYNHVKSAIYYSAGLRGHFGNSVPFNIETLVNTLNELDRNEDHPIYPFVASWNSRFLDLAGPNFGQIKLFRGKILGKLKDWMCPDSGSKSAYYEGLIEIQRRLNYPLRVFSLNYDLCVESVERDTFRVEKGFSGYGPQHSWDLQRFVEEQAIQDSPPQVFLYKLHGSINWKREPKSQRLYQVNQVQSVDSKAMELIFGREFKLEAADPYLFYTYEFRRLTAAAKAIVTIGYGFADSHINKIVAQAMRQERGPVLKVFTRCSAEEVEPTRSRVASILERDEDPKSCEVIACTAKELLSREDVGDYVASMIPGDADPFAL